MQDNFKHGSYLGICMRCGFQYHKEHLFLECTNLRVCRSCLPRHPDPLTCGGTGKVGAGESTPAWTRPVNERAEDLYVDRNYWILNVDDPEEYETRNGESILPY